MAPIPVAVLGYGNSARTFHIPFIYSLPEHFSLKVVVQRPRKDLPETHQAQLHLPHVQVVPDVDAALRALPEGQGLVVITTNNVSHYPYAKQCLESGKHVLVEKPVATTEAQVHELDQLARKQGLVCTVYQSMSMPTDSDRRFDGDFLTIKALLSDASPTQPSALGTPTYFESRFDRFRPIAKGGWREEVDPVTEGGGMLWDLGAHLVDQVVSLFGPPQTVFGTVRNQRGQGSATVDDDWTGILTYPATHPLPGDEFAPGTRLAGLQVIVGSTCLSAHVEAEQMRFRVEGTRGSYVKWGKDPQEAQLKKGWTPLTHGDSFGVYEEQDPASLKMGRLTTSAPSLEPITAANPPVLATHDIPTLPGTYLSLYKNLADTIHASAAATERGESANKIIDTMLSIPLEQAAHSTRVIRMIRQSSREGRVLSWNDVEQPGP